MTTRTTTHTRTARHQRIVEIIQGDSIRSQGEIVDRLAEEGYDVTQATLSRDLVELGAAKVRQGRALVYAVPGPGVDRTPRSGGQEHEGVDVRLRRVAAELLLDTEVNKDLVILRTPPGAASFLASAIDLAGLPTIMGCVAGDDTILVIARSGSSGKAVAAMLLDLAAQTSDDPHRTTTVKEQR